MSGWWRSNAVPLAAILVLVPVLTASIWWNEGIGAAENGGGRPLTLPPGESIEYGGATIGPATAEFTDSPLAPQGTRVVSVSLRVDPGDEPLVCGAPPLHETGGAHRQWDSASYELDRGWDVNHPTSCISDETRPYTLEIDYLVPSDASGPFTVEFDLAVESLEYVSAIVEP